jgi:hypothetical protein
MNRKTEGGHDGRTTMTPLRTAWRRAVTVAAEPTAGGRAPGLAELLAYLGPGAAASDWSCDGVEADGPAAADLRREARAGSIPGGRLVELARGITSITGGVFEATCLGEERPWLGVRAGDGQVVIATRSRGLLDDLRRRFGDGAP